MRIWDIPCNQLCDRHLLGEHRELHAIWTYLTTDKGKSYRKHPETLRWVGKEAALALRHVDEIFEMSIRGFKHNSDILPPTGSLMVQNKFVHSIEQQVEILKAKGCKCKVY